MSPWQQLEKATEERGFPCDPGHDVISRTVSESQSKVAVAEAGDSLGTKSKENVHHWKPLPSNG
jgi:hypothetical protein